ncbi:MAG: hypothetical protein JRI23_31430, partial [Deltaproteobacteria bacterium]|nr:hypothetical protein [Deltaproteobacteria bacterium]MBW2536722.1 hypothetical protein [Deltaproteobacteria bacterium]
MGRAVPLPSVGLVGACLIGLGACNALWGIDELAYDAPPATGGAGGGT